MISQRQLGLLIVALLCTIRPAIAQEGSPEIPAEPADHALLLDDIDWQAFAGSLLGRAVADREIPGATVVIVNHDGIVFRQSFGVSNLDTEEPVTDSTLFEVGSIGKVLTAIAALQQAERGSLDLHADVNSYLREWKIDQAGDSPLTLHHLLTHTGGFNDRAIGYAVKNAEAVQPLEAHLASYFPTSFASPGRYVSYSNYGFGLAGYLVESVTRKPFSDYVADEILRPLGIYGSGYRPDVHGPMAVGYLIGENGPRPAPDFYRHVTPAGSFVASARDMAVILMALLNGGGSILSGESVAMMTKVQHTQHELLMGNSYGLEESRWGDVRGFGKGGSIPGFASYAAVIPEHGLGVFVAANSSSDDAIDTFVTAALGRTSDETPDAATLPAVDVSPYVGEYRSNRYDRTSIEKLLRMEIHNIYLSGDGNLSLWHDGSMNSYRPIEELVFQNEEDPNRFLVFEKDERGSVEHAFFNERFAGGYVPVVWERNGFWNSNTYVNEYFGVIVLMALGYLLFPVALGVRTLWKRIVPGRKRVSQVSWWLHIVGLLTSLGVLLYVLFYFVPLLRARSDLVFGVPSGLATWSGLPWFIVVSFGAFAVVWLNGARERGRLSLLPGLLFVASGALLCEFFIRWNLL
jgi:CubicO group peptidase (beta-lactamase class C family)